MFGSLGLPVPSLALSCLPTSCARLCLPFRVEDCKFQFQDVYFDLRAYLCQILRDLACRRAVPGCVCLSGWRTASSSSRMCVLICGPTCAKSYVFLPADEMCQAVSLPNMMVDWMCCAK